MFLPGNHSIAISLWSPKHQDISKILFFSFAGRTFPTHPYFSAQLGAGQLSLFNLLKAYSLLDKEVGYCQGISFVAGVLLLHMSEEQAFEMLKFLMYDLGFRKQYRPDMMSLQVSGTSSRGTCNAGTRNLSGSPLLNYGSDLKKLGPIVLELGKM